MNEDAHMNTKEQLINGIKETPERYLSEKGLAEPGRG
jgi:hypothetical protein